MEIQRGGKLPQSKESELREGLGLPQAQATPLQQPQAPYAFYDVKIFVRREGFKPSSIKCVVRTNAFLEIHTAIVDYLKGKIPTDAKVEKVDARKMEALFLLTDTKKVAEK